MLFNLFHSRYLISLTYLLLVVIGIIAWRNVPLEMAPDLNLPSVTVSYSWGSTSPTLIKQGYLLATDPPAVGHRY